MGGERGGTPGSWGGTPFHLTWPFLNLFPLQLPTAASGERKRLKAVLRRRPREGGRSRKERASAARPPILHAGPTKRRMGCSHSDQHSDPAGPEAGLDEGLNLPSLSREEAQLLEFASARKNSNAGSRRGSRAAGLAGDGGSAKPRALPSTSALPAAAELRASPSSSALPAAADAAGDARARDAEAGEAGDAAAALVLPAGGDTRAALLAATAGAKVCSRPCFPSAAP